jgi:hypothetical protein
MNIPPVRKIRYRSHKRFANHSRIVDGVWVTPADAGGRSVGSKQLLPGDYPEHTRHSRTRAEMLNAALRAADL